MPRASYGPDTAVFVNGELVPKAKYDTTQVPDGAEAKVVHQIAGG